MERVYLLPNINLSSHQEIENKSVSGSIKGAKLSRRDERSPMLY
jgi:hypothetical protein